MNNQSAVTELLFQTDPVHVFEYDGKIAFLAQEIGDILGILKVSKSIRGSNALEEGVDYAVIPTNTLDLSNQKLLRYGKKAPKVIILYLSGFFTFVLRSNKDIAVPFNRWATREAIPQAFQKRQVPEITEKGLIQLVGEERRGSAIARVMLAAHGWSDPTAPKQLTIDGGDHE